MINDGEKRQLRKAGREGRRKRKEKVLKEL